MLEEIPKALRPLKFHCVFPQEGPYRTSGDDVMGTCPFCGRDVACDGSTGQWVCHSSSEKCGRSGNVPSFMSQIVDHYHANVTPRMWRVLSKKRGIPPGAYRRWRVGWCDQKFRWTIPTVGADGAILDIRVTKKKTIATPGKTQLWNWEGLLAADPTAVVYICEGEWDGMALDWLLSVTKKKRRGKDFVVVAVPGARQCKSAWVTDMKRFDDVLVCGDNDGDGDAMQEKWWRNLKDSVAKISFLNWPRSWPSKYDIGDLIKDRLEKDRSRQSIRRELKRMVSTTARTMPYQGQEDFEAARTGKRLKIKRKKGRRKARPTFDQTVTRYEKHLKLTKHHKAALACMFAVYYSTRWDSDPLWMFLVGSPGSGKTELLVSMIEAEDSRYYSEVHSSALVSGWAAKEDPSQIPLMIDQCNVFKDWTEMILGHPTEIEKTQKILRGWYDGHVVKPFGHIATREYKGTGNILAGVTNVIHGRSDSSVGERFLKIQLPRMPRKMRDDVVMAAMLGVTKEGEKNTELQEAASLFLDHEFEPVDPLKAIGMDYLIRIRSMSTIIAILRAEVEWQRAGWDRELTHRPEPELPTRIGKQLTKLSLGLLPVFGKRKMNDSIFAVVEKVAFNTAHGFNLDIVEAMMQTGGVELTVDGICHAAKMHKTTLKRKLDDLHELNVIKKTAIKPTKKRRKQVGRQPLLYSVVPSMRTLWKMSNPSDTHIKEAIKSRRKREGWK